MGILQTLFSGDALFIWFVIYLLSAVGIGYLLNIHMKNKFLAGILSGILIWPFYAVASIPILLVLKLIFD
jgi:hypothetical protein